ncbi:MAG: response regulator [Leptospira sp.]|nr:response regulator [Leptospira sp.]
MIFTIGILGLAAFSYYSSQRLTEKIESLTLPNKKSAYIKEINTSLTKFTNLYFESPNSLLYSKEHDEIIGNIRETISLLRELYSEDEVESIEALDSIPEILDSITKAHREIRYLNKQYQDDFYERVEEEILKKITINDLKDAGYVEEKVKNEIIKIIEKDTALKEAQKPPQDNQGLLGNLFSSKEPEKPKTNITEKVSNVKKEALLSSDIDNLFFSKKVDYIKNEVNKVLYQEQIKAIKIRSKEKQIFNSNVALINKLESIFHKIQREEDQKLRETTISTYNASKRFNKILIFIITAFGLSSLALLFFLFKDIERNRYYQKLLRASEKKALRKAREKQRFLSTMSHELRTPLTSILGFTELLDHKTDYKQAIYSSSKYLLNIVNEIFDLAKIEEGKIEIKPEVVNITSLLNELKLGFKDLIENAGLSAEFNLPGENLFIEIDPNRIKQVLFNLVHNAIKFTPNGFVRIDAQIKNLDENTIELSISVVDSGIGIKDDDQEKIFKEFIQSGSDKDKLKGIGLGLGIVKKIMQEMGGTIQLTSKVGEGSEFKLQITAPTKKIDDIRFTENCDIDKKILEGYKVLTLDDDEFISKLYGDILFSYGADVTKEMDPYKALELLSSNHNYDLFITDIKMPQITGLELLEKLKTEGIQAPKTLGVTANIFFEEENSNFDIYLDAVLLKPFTRDELILKIMEILSIETNNLTISKSSEFSQSIDSNIKLKIDSNLELIIQSTSEIPNSKELFFPSFNLDHFKKMAMNDPELIKENLNLFYSQNIIDLKLVDELLENCKYFELAEIVHKLSGRFSQVSANVRHNPKMIELKLRSFSSNEISEPFLIQEMSELIQDWRIINESLKPCIFTN